MTRYTIAIVTSPNRHNNNTATVQYDRERTYLMIDVETLIRIRIFVEDIDTFHTGAEQLESYFGKLMTDDFFHPIQMYRLHDNANRIGRNFQ